MLLLTLFALYFVIVYEPYNFAYRRKSKPKRPTRNEHYLININASKINTLFEILHNNERRFGGVLNDLGLIVFEKYIYNQSGHGLEGYSAQGGQFLRVKDNQIRVTEKFVEHLRRKSIDHLMRRKKGVQIAKIQNV